MSTRTPALPPGGHRARAWLRRRWVRIVLAVALALVLAGAVADQIDLGYYVLTPGTALPVTAMVKVPARVAHRGRGGGRILMTDVLVSQVTALGYIPDKLNGDAAMVPAVTLLGPGVPSSQLATQGYLQMAQSQAAAKAAALRRLGYHVGVRDTGVVVYAVEPKSPATRALSVGQIVRAVNGTPTPDACSFSQALATRSAGARVDLSVELSSVTAQAKIVPGRAVRRVVRLGRWPASVPRPAATPRCPGVANRSRGYLGVQVETQQAWSYPFPVSLRTTAIGGPSAGLAMSLGIIDRLSASPLTSALVVAATGTIDPNGQVGEVGGVPQKTVAVERAGATAFFVPAAQRATALSKATPNLHVYGVTSLGQVLSDLRRLGGAPVRQLASRVAVSPVPIRR